MKLINATMRPGRVLEVLENGNIKASAPGVFSFEDKDKIPPVMPFCGLMGAHANAFSAPTPHEEIWLLSLSDNPRQLYWFRKDPYVKSNANITGEDVEILVNRDLGGAWATIYFSDGTGWVIANGESKMQIRADGSIILTTDMPKRSIDINSDNISIGSPGTSSHPAAYGDVVQEAIKEIHICLEMVKQAANTNPYTKGIATAIANTPKKLEDLNEKIVSQNVTLD